MALLYSLTGAKLHEEPGYSPFEPKKEFGGAFDFPDELSDKLHRFHLRGRKQWENEDEHRERLHGEESARNSDPQTLYAAVAELLGLAKQVAAVRQETAPTEDGPAGAATDGEAQANPSRTRKTSTPAR